MKYYKLAFQKFAQFNGRSSRPEYWYFVLFNMIFGIAATILDNMLGLNFVPLPYGIVYAVYALIVFVPGLSAAVRRLHDVNKSGWFLLIALIPILGAIWLLVVLASKGTKGENKYGADPYSEGQPTFDFEATPAT